LIKNNSLHLFLKEIFLKNVKIVYYLKVRSGCELNFRVSFINFQGVVQGNEKRKTIKAQLLRLSSLMFHAETDCFIKINF